MSSRKGKFDVDNLVNPRYKPASQLQNYIPREPDRVQFDGQSKEEHYGQFTKPQMQSPKVQVIPQLLAGQAQYQQQQYQQQQQQQQYQQPPPPQQYEQHQHTETMKTVNTETTVLHFDQKTLRNLCLIPMLVILILGLLVIGIWRMQHESAEPHHSLQSNIPHAAWSNTSENAEQVAKVYSIFYPYVITNFGEWEQIPSKGDPGIPGLKQGDFAKLVSMHSCCKTKHKFFICSNANRVDGTSFDIRLTEEDGQIYLQVYSSAKLLTGATCNLEMEFSQQ